MFRGGKLTETGSSVVPCVVEHSKVLGGVVMMRGLELWERPAFAYDSETLRDLSFEVGVVHLANIEGSRGFSYKTPCLNR